MGTIEAHKRGEDMIIYDAQYSRDTVENIRINVEFGIVTKASVINALFH